MKLPAVLVIVAVALWYFLTPRSSVASSPVVAAVAPAVVGVAKPTSPSAAPANPPPAAPTLVLAAADKPVTADKPANAPQLVLKNALGPDNHYHDDLLGLSATFPQGWKVAAAKRWGTANHENTVWLQPEVATSARPSMYYKQYVETPPDRSTAETYLRDQAQQKEDFRIGNGLTDYKNVPESFSYYDINGSPALSYFATFTKGDEVMTEYFIRVLSPNGYVMFFTTGKLDDVKAVMPQVKQMASSLKGP